MTIADTGGDRGGADGTALERCVGRTAAVFPVEHWGRVPLLTRAVDLPGAFDDLLDAVAVDELVSRRGLRTPFLRMAKEGSVLPTGRFTRAGGAGATIADQAADDKILAVMADGGTLVLQALHRTWPPLVEFASQLSHDLGHAVQVNAYITPPENQGFDPHYDVHDVFVLQVAGRKRWTVHAPIVDAPLENQAWDKRAADVAAAADGEALIDTVIGPGDAMYLPRGTIHSAAALGETSIHLTVGVHPLTRYHLVQHLLEAAQDDPQLRSSLPMGVDLGDPGVLAAEFEATVERLRDHLLLREVEPAARHLETMIMRRTRPEPVGPLAQLDAAASLSSASRVRLRRGLRVRVEHDGDQIRLVLLDRTVVVPSDAADAVKLATTGAPVRVGDLPGLDANGRLTLVRRLVREAVLVPADGRLDG